MKQSSPSKDPKSPQENTAQDTSPPFQREAISEIKKTINHFLEKTFTTNEKNKKIKNLAKVIFLVEELNNLISLKTYRCAKYFIEKYNSQDNNYGEEKTHIISLLNNEKHKIEKAKKNLLKEFKPSFDDLYVQKFQEIKEKNPKIMDKNISFEQYMVDLNHQRLHSDWCYLKKKLLRVKARMRQRDKKEGHLSSNLIEETRNKLNELLTLKNTALEYPGPNYTHKKRSETMDLITKLKKTAQDIKKEIPETEETTRKMNILEALYKLNPKGFFIQEEGYGSLEKDTLEKMIFKHMDLYLDHERKNRKMEIIRFSLNMMLDEEKAKKIRQSTKNSSKNFQELVHTDNLLDSPYGKIQENRIILLKKNSSLSTSYDRLLEFEQLHDQLEKMLPKTFMNLEKYTQLALEVYPAVEAAWIEDFTQRTQETYAATHEEYTPPSQDFFLFSTKKMLEDILTQRKHQQEDEEERRKAGWEKRIAEHEKKLQRQEEEYEQQQRPQQQPEHQMKKEQNLSKSQKKNQKQNQNQNKKLQELPQDMGHSTSENFSPETQKHEEEEKCPHAEEELRRRKQKQAERDLASQ